MNSAFSQFADWCGGESTFLRGSLFASLFAAGLAGSAFHCVPMCGALVLGQVSDQLTRIPIVSMCEWRRIGAGALLPYHAGRLATYALLGAATGLVSGWLAQAHWLRGLSAAMLMLAAISLMLQATGLAPRWEFVPLSGARWRGTVSRVAAAVGQNGFGLGLALGLLPCGLIYGALLAASSAAGPLTAAAAMVAFGLGTVPALVVVGVAGQAAGHRWRASVRAASPILLSLSAAALLWMALLQWRAMA